MKKIGLIAMPLLAVALLTNCNKSNWWDHTDQLTEADIGKIETITVNNQNHRVRLIDVDHDVLSNDTSKTAHCTFEFSNLLSDSYGYSLATLWNTTNGNSSKNYDYLNSDLRVALDGSGDVRWYQKGSGTKSTNYKDSVIKMLPDGIQKNIKTVKKEVAITSKYSITSYVAKVFVLTYNETTKNRDWHAKEEGTTYQYYKDHDDYVSRIKQQVKGQVDAAHDKTNITDLGYEGAYNYAGYNDNYAAFYGGFYWLTSPYTDNTESAWYVCGNGTFDNVASRIYYGAYAIAPAFCI